MLAVTGHHFHDVIDTHAQQDVSLDRVFIDVAVYNTHIMGKGHVEPATNLACPTALAYRGVAHIVGKADLVVDEGERRVRFIEVEQGGVLRVGAKDLLVPVDAITHVDDDRVRIDLTRERISGAPRDEPHLDEDKYWTDVYSYRRCSPCWAAGYRPAHVRERPLAVTGPDAFEAAAVKVLPRLVQPQAWGRQGPLVRCE